MPTRQAQRDLLELILENAPVGVALLTADDLTYEYVNPAYQAIAPEKSMLGRRYADVWPEVADQLVPLVQQVVETGESWIGEGLPLEIRREPDRPSELVYFTFVVSRLMVDGDWHVLTTVYEVTREVEARSRIERERGLLQAVLAAMKEAVIISDADPTSLT